MGYPADGYREFVKSYTLNEADFYQQALMVLPICCHGISLSSTRSLCDGGRTFMDLVSPLPVIAVPLRECSRPRHSKQRPKADENVGCEGPAISAMTLSKSWWLECGNFTDDVR